MNIKFHKVTALPATLEADAFYYVENGTYAESYITNNAGEARAIGNSTMINALIDARFAASNVIEIVADIAARDTLTNTATSNLIILVEDASADPTVTSGAALYSWNDDTDTATKLSEYESLDVQVSWGAIAGRPASSPAAIDSAVSDSHSHSNMTVLNKLSENAGGELLHNGNLVGSSWTTNNF